MGLDMYLSKKYYVKNWGHTPKDRIYKITVKKGGKPSGIDPSKVCYIETQEIYWRKANAIHKWFVDHCQDGVDDCRQAYVSREQLADLLSVVCDVIGKSNLVADKISAGSEYKDGKWTELLQDGKRIEDPTLAKKLLPVERGCFFGGYDYDQFYYDDLVHTKSELERVLATDDDGDFFYQSSW